MASIAGICTTAAAQHVYQIRADSVRIYNVCDTAELIIENRTRGVSGSIKATGGRSSKRSAWYRWAAPGWPSPGRIRSTWRR